MSGPPAELEAAAARPKRDPMAWRWLEPSVLVLVLGAALALRGASLGLEELSTDEAFSWRLATYAPADVVARTARDVHPPLYYLVLHAWMAWCGGSPAAMRALSLLLGLVVVLAAYAVGREVGRWSGEGATPRRVDAGAVMAALLVAVHADQVGHSRHVRMYAMGAALAGLSAWLLLRALGSSHRVRAWWAGWAVAAAALCYTHYYGAFTVAAQLVFAGAVTARDGWGPRRRHVLAWVGGLAVLAALYAPWLPVVLRQTGRVSEQYWISDQGPADVAAAVMRWITGIEWAPPLPALALAALAAAAAWAFWKADRGQRFLLWQATVPWLGAFALSALAGRWLLLERYLFFSQFALLVFLARAWTGLAAPWTQRALAVAMGSALAAGLANEVGGRPTGEGATPQGARFLGRTARATELVLANAPRDLLVVRYYLAREGAGPLEVKCPASRSVGHLSQVAAIEGHEIVEDGRVWTGRWPRVWFVRVHPTRRWRPEPPPPGWTDVFTRIFEGAGSTRLLVMAFERREVQSSPAPRPASR